MAATDWWIVVPWSEIKSNTIPADAKVVGVPAGSATDTAFLNTQEVNGLGGFMGPFPTKAKAQSARPEGTGGLIGAYTGAALGELGIGAISPGTKAAVGGAAEGSAAGTSTENAVLTTGQFLGRLTDASLWLRVTKVAAGGIILIVGLAKLTGADNKVNGTAGKAIKTAVKVAPLL